MMTSSNGNIFRVTGHLCGNSPVPGEFPAQRPVTWSFDVFFDLRLNKRLSKQSWSWWFETLSSSLWRHHNEKKNPNIILFARVIWWSYHKRDKPDLQVNSFSRPMKGLYENIVSNEYVSTIYKAVFITNQPEILKNWSNFMQILLQKLPWHFPVRNGGSKCW